MRLLRVLLVISILLLSEASRDFDHETTREEILASRQRRRVQLEAMLKEEKQRLADHRNGVRMLDEVEVTALEKKVDVYERKLATMQGELDEREIERIMKREQLRNERIKERRERASEL